mgnify:FL=1
MQFKRKIFDVACMQLFIRVQGKTYPDAFMQGQDVWPRVQVVRADVVQLARDDHLRQEKDAQVRDGETVGGQDTEI